jgi:23S rRNA (adenine2503-C2)-methyltransferase
MDASGRGREPNLYGMERDRLREAFAGLGARPFHGNQAYRWMYAKGVLDPDAWTDLARDLRNRVRDAFRIDRTRVVRHAEAPDGTVKFRVELPDGGTAESVSMMQGERVTLCISSQVGCALACDFCLTGRMGLERNLDAGEIVGQVATMVEDLSLHADPFNIVFMGMGEPLHNYDAVMSAVRILTDPEGLGMSWRRLTVSTVGLVPAIERLAGEAVRPRLAVSLNATTDEVRERIMPVNGKYPLDDLLAACRTYTAATGEAVTFEYVLLHGVNDTNADVARLERLLADHRAKLNLIPFNPVPGWLDYEPPSERRVKEIRDRLLAAGRRVSVRWSRGRDARAACGQLALLEGDPPGKKRGGRRRKR